MPLRLFIALFVVVPGCLVMSTGTVRADAIFLSRSGALRGTITRDEPTEDSVQITLLNGASVTVDRARVREIVRQPLKFEEYEVKAHSVENTLDAQWELAEWCREKNLDDQRAVHLEAVLKFDPEHKRAHYGLGHTQFDDEWLTKAEYEQRRIDEGFVKFDGKWVPADQLDSLQATAKRTKSELAWFSKVRLWLNWATGNHKERAADGLANLRNVTSPDAIPALIQFLGKSQHADVRQAFVDILARIGSEKGVPSLTTLAIRDSVPEIREKALESIPDEHASLGQSILIRGLRDTENVIVKRSAAALGRKGDETAVPALIRSLVTTHGYKIRVPVQGYSFGSNGSFGGAGDRFGLPPEIAIGLRTGRYERVDIIPYPGSVGGATKVVPFQLSHENQESLAALRKLTKQDFGYDETRWLRWWNVERHQKTLAPDLP
ncbi:MAG: HEAT repeat domain-containing protein [Planctomycetota bacterium]|nr:HEAT repeat domain-containing protein [Planctomycetota bacterium]MDA1249414.1 HEAT repeat domain-containing protein [Planctomycetota bacterium]